MASPLGDGIYVIRFSDENRSQHRIFGFFDVARRAFVMALPGGERDGKYFPSDYAKKTLERRELVSRGAPGRIKPCIHSCWGRAKLPDEVP